MAWMRVIKKKKKTDKHTQTSTHKLAQQVIFSESNSQMAELTTTHTKTDLGLWVPYTDQGKTAWRVKTLREAEKNSP